MPLNPEKVESWRKALGETPDQIEATKEELDKTLNELIEDITCGFRSGEKGLYIADFQIKSMLKESGEGLRRGGVQKITSYRQRIGKDTKIYADYITNNPQRGPVYGAYLKRDGEVIVKPDGITDGLIHTPRISALKRSEYVNPPCYIEFQVKVVGTSLSKKELQELFEHGGEFIGQLSDRGLENGRFHLAHLEEVMGQI